MYYYNILSLRLKYNPSNRGFLNNDVYLYYILNIDV